MKTMIETLKELAQRIEVAKFTQEVLEKRYDETGYSEALEKRINKHIAEVKKIANVLGLKVDFRPCKSLKIERSADVLEKLERMVRNAIELHEEMIEYACERDWVRGYAPKITKA